MALWGPQSGPRSQITSETIRILPRASIVARFGEKKAIHAERGFAHTVMFDQRKELYEDNQKR
jgi:hypothetical protein